MRSQTLRVLLPLLGLALAACGSSGSGPSNAQDQDASSLDGSGGGGDSATGDAANDGGADAVQIDADTGVFSDAAGDAGTDASDSGTDAGADAGDSGSSDAGADASDSGTETGADAGDSGSSDSGSDASDASIDANDAGTDASIDASDASTDASDAGIDASTDASDASDASTDASDAGDAAASYVCTSGIGFAKNPLSFALPTDYAKGFWNDLSGSTYCDSYNGYARPAYHVIDLDGDALPDLVVTETCSGSLAGDDPDVGKTKWLLYHNTGSRFAQVPTAFALPTDYAKGFWNDLSGSTYCDSYNGYARPAYELMDMDGDGKLDLLVTETCSGSLAGSDPDVGRTKWLVYRNTGAGFATTKAAFALPTDYAKGFWNSTSGSTYCDSYNGYARPAYEVRDMTGDGLPDLLVTDTCSGSLAGSDPDVGATKWRVYAGGASGFSAAPADFALPTDYAKGFWNSTSGSTYCDSYNGYARPAYELRDMNADGLPDLLVTETCSGSLSGSDPAVGEAYWLVYRAGAAGYDSAAYEWCLPTDYAKGFWNSTSGSTYCDSYNGYARPAYATLDMVGNASPEMTVMDTCTGTLAGDDPDVGQTKWLVY